MLAAQADRGHDGEAEQQHGRGPSQQAEPARRQRRAVVLLLQRVIRTEQGRATDRGGQCTVDIGAALDVSRDAQPHDAFDVQVGGPGERAGEQRQRRQRPHGVRAVADE